ncbi:MAG: diadenylate cyclase, partial [Candidatus Tectomicrobia bacterium]|nr:diadenylate cyclase [Candidatus Tectomicrobia bacterium]
MAPPHTVYNPEIGEEYFQDIQYHQESIPRHVMLELLELAIEIAREGREGRKIGTLFVLGDEDEVVKRSRCLILDPLSGHPKASKKLSDPNLRETVKELAQLDGGFLVSADGSVLSAARYFNAHAQGLELLLGLGSRHIAAASMTQQTDALAIVVSESSIVRVFNGGVLIAEILPEIYLLNRFNSHVKHPRLTEHPEENIAV